RREAVTAELTPWLEKNPPPAGSEMRGTQPVLRWKQQARKLQIAGVGADREKEADAWIKRWSQASQRARAQADLGQTELLRQDGRPVCSYTANLERIADELLDTDAAWVAIVKPVVRTQSALDMMLGSRPQPVNERRLANQMVLQYPWGWSAGVLAALLGLSL